MCKILWKQRAQVWYFFHQKEIRHRVDYLDQGHLEHCHNFIFSGMKTLPISLLLFWTKTM